MKQAIATALIYLMIISSLSPAWADDRDRGGSLSGNSTSALPPIMTTLLGPDSIEEKIDQFVVDFNRSKLEIQSYIQQSRQLEGAIHAPNADPEGAFQAALGLVKMQAQGTSGSTIPSRGNIIGAEIAKRAANRANGTLSLIKGIASKLFHSDVASYNQVVCYLTLRWWYFPIDRDAIASLLMRIPYMSNDDAVGVGADHSLKYIGNGMLYASFAAALISHNLPAIRSKVGAILASRTTFSGLGGLFRSIKKFKPKLPKKSSILPAIKRVGGKASNTYQVGKTAVKLVAVKTYQKGKNVADLYKNRADYITWLKQAKIPHPRQVFQDWMKTFSEKHSTPEAKMEFRRYLKLRVREFVGKTAVSLIGMGAGGSLGYGAMLFNQTQEVNIDPKDALLWISFLGAGELATDLVELRAQTTQMRNQIPRDSKGRADPDAFSKKTKGIKDGIVEGATRLLVQFGDASMKLEHFQGEFCEPRFCGRFNPQTGQREAPVTYRPDGWVVKANPNLFRNSEVTMQDRLSSFAGRYPQLFSVIKQGEQQLIRQGARSVSIDVMSEMAEAFDPLLKELMGFSEFLRISIK